MKKVNDPEKIAGLLKDGALIIFPTDTVVGLGCRFDSEEGISRIRKIKGVNSGNPLAALISSVDDLDKLRMRRNRNLNKVIDKLWPGGLTVVLTSENSYPCGGNGNTLGLRMPDSALLRKIIMMTGAPIAATSANFHGDPPPSAIGKVNSKILKQADYILDIPIKGIGLASTVIRFEAAEVEIIREGSVSADEIFDSMRNDS